MKVLLLGFTKISYMPYMHFYLDKLLNCEVHLLYWDRDGKPDSEIPEGVMGHRFYCYQEDSVPAYQKISSFLKYRRAALELVKKGKFDFLIVLHSTTGIILQDILKRKFKGKYVFDYRDFTYEDTMIYKKMVHQLANNSAATFVSSDAFRKYLPQNNKIYTSHNLLLESMEYRDVRKKYSRDVDPIRIRYWGLIRHTNINKVIIDSLANDARFELHYHGREQGAGKKLKEYCAEIGATNIFFHGEYKPEDRYVFAAQTDIIHNIYANDIKTQPAMGNKLYDGIIFYIPQLCNQGSFMAEQIDKFDVGFSCDPANCSFADDIYKYYKSLSFEILENNCDNAVRAFMADYKKGCEVINNCISEPPANGGFS